MSDLLTRFCVGIFLLLLSTHYFVDFAKKISNALKISPLIIGTTLVALGTSLPELSVSLVAVFKNDFGLAFGNIIGSNVANILLVLPVGIIIGKLRIGTKKTQINAYLLLITTGIFIFSQKAGYPSLSGILLITLAILVTFLEYKWAVFGQTHEDKSQFKNYKKLHLGAASLVFTVISLLGIISGGYLIVSSVENISLATGLSTTFLGLTLTAIVTSLPELLTTIFSQEEDQEKITIGNIIGSNIYNLLFIGGLITLFSPTKNLLIGDLIWLIITTIFFVYILKHYKGKPVPRRIGALLLLVFIIYLYSLKQ
ncbi:hypothetical protein A3D00_00300 [Candidatus Woesebacteria bacterium RIFCSPHIGHO2_02_FULL_38_9]|uniref:Sodium/calcium exchanger membrane region domain-containing protein n=1 Tax=Candidatus Woesebacteria bacterium RIFCSPHIGHO2_01_FULL_39_28 TaxID=1802496 RepID=A0A1F7YBJ6_9BACT|nr:MAG: hypothetical protein A2627_02590 [Candidatus Woesebacteria bacterium RIFCSPHIGHO2_01_FULL_39_28]OGM33110.1 MAG: hypothetical protein A3D00_00300 [Candidatus Woesebacteria bacterium RIFCSPHIGHO2_02_FULL_38_9]OGM58390.1 MAG: hypothetical protein A3A50_02515 [Candidatus Woesebacteria bacterium RIFCSPLOWO2_01_FULL_38_20]